MYTKNISTNFRNSLILLIFLKFIEKAHKTDVLWLPSGSPKNPFKGPTVFISC